MKKQFLVVLVTAVVAYTLGVHTGSRLQRDTRSDTHAAVPTTASVNTASPDLYIQDLPESPAAHRQASEAQGLREAPPGSSTSTIWGVAEPQPIRVGSFSLVSSDNEEEMRTAAMREARQQYGDFFLLSDILSSEADAIIQQIADLKIEQRRLMDSPEWMAMFLGSLDDDEAAREAVFDSMRDLERKEEEALGMHAESYQQYRMQEPYNRVVANVTRSLGRRLNITTRDELLRIIIEESQGSPGVLATTPEDARKMGLEESRQRSARIKERARSYLAYDEYESLVRTLDREVERWEAQLRLMELSRPD